MLDKLVEDICRLNDQELNKLAEICMDKGIAVPLEFALHTAQLEADYED
jgi:hypothetical protein